MLISRPSQSFLMVAIPVFDVFLFTMSLTVDCVTPESVQSLLIVRPRSPQSCRSLFVTASEIVIQESSCLESE